VLDDGQIVQRGRHWDLLALGGPYAEMWAKQQQARDRGELETAAE
jgi:ATP-binding cassette subfamily B protein